MSYIAIREESLPRVRAWLRNLAKRRHELTELARAQTVSHEVAHLIEGENGPVLVYAVEADDVDAARTAFADARLPLAAEWQQLITECALGHPAHEVLFEHIAGRGSSPAG